MILHIFQVTTKKTEKQQKKTEDVCKILLEDLNLLIDPHGAKTVFFASKFNNYCKRSNTNSIIIILNLRNPNVRNPNESNLHIVTIKQPTEIHI